MKKKRRTPNVICTARAAAKANLKLVFINWVILFAWNMTTVSHASAEVTQSKSVRIVVDVSEKFTYTLRANSRKKRFKLSCTYAPDYLRSLLGYLVGDFITGIEFTEKAARNYDFIIHTKSEFTIEHKLHESPRYLIIEVGVPDAIWPKETEHLLTFQPFPTFTPDFMTRLKESDPKLDDITAIETAVKQYQSDDFENAYKTLSGLHQTFHGPLARYPELLFAYAESALFLGKLKQAMRICRETVRRNPAHPLGLLANVRIGDVLWLRGDTELARNHFEYDIKYFYEGDATILATIHLGYLVAINGDFAQFEYLEHLTALPMTPYIKAEALFYLGKFSELRGDYSAGHGYFQKLRKDYPQNKYWKITPRTFKRAKYGFDHP